jgi:hypothetical protein
VLSNLEKANREMWHSMDVGDSGYEKSTN